MERIMIAEKLTTTANQYIQFMSTIGSKVPEKTIPSNFTAIFSSDVVKIENGKHITSGYAELESQLLNAQQYGAPWTIKILDILSDEKQHSAVVRFTWDSAKAGLHITTAILKINEEYKIKEILEVYNKHSDITH